VDALRHVARWNGGGALLAHPRETC
jgi:hypothetical protein